MIWLLSRCNCTTLRLLSLFLILIATMMMFPSILIPLMLHSILFLYPLVNAWSFGLARENQKKLMSCRMAYTNHLLKKLNSLVTNPFTPVNSRSKGLGDGDKIFCCHKNKKFCGCKRSFKALIEEGVFQKNSYHKAGYVKPSFFTSGSLDNYSSMTANGVLHELHKRQKIQNQIKKIK